MKIITITSGKGGVGKTNLSVNIGISLAYLGYKVCLFDADIGLANINILMGLAVEDTLEDVMEGRKRLSEIIIKNWNGIDIIPGSSGIKHFESIGEKKLNSLLVQFSEIEDYDYIIVDTGAGISKHVVSFCMASNSLILVMVPEPTSLTDAYALLKILTFNGYKNKVNIIINRCKNIKLGPKVFEKFRQTTSKYIKLGMNYLGALPEDDRISDAVSNQSPFIKEYPSRSSSLAVMKIAEEITKMETEEANETKGFNSFIKNYSRLFQSRLKLTKKTPGKNAAEKERKENQEKTEVIKNKDNGEITKLLRLLVENTSRISGDLREIKELLLKQNKKEEENISDHTGNIDQYAERDMEKDMEKDMENKMEPPVITLDFEKFISKKQ